MQEECDVGVKNDIMSRQTMLPSFTGFGYTVQDTEKWFDISQHSTTVG